MIRIFAPLILCLALSACLTVDKAKGFLRDKKQLDDICAQEYPAKTTGVDSADYKKAMEKIDSLLNEFFEFAPEDTGSGHVPGASWSGPGEPSDSLLPCEDELQGLYRQAAERERVVKNMKLIVLELRNQVKNLPPKNSLVIDSARIQGLHDIISEQGADNSKLIHLLSDAEDDLKMWKAKAKKRFWAVVGLSGLGVLFLFLGIRRKVKK